MDQLLVEILELIFNKLDFDEKLVVRNVSKKWQAIIDQMITKKPLWLKKCDEVSIYYRFFDSKKIFENYEFNISNSLLSFRLCEDIHSKIEKLITYCPFVLINLKLDNLKHLEIKNNKQISRSTDIIDFILNHMEDQHQNQPINLKFKELRTFAFKARTDLKINLDANLLVNMDVWCDLKYIHVLNPKSVRKLAVNKLSNELNNFKELTNLKIDTLDFKHGISNFNLIKQFTNLKELMILDMNKTNFDKLVKQKLNSKSNLKFYYKSVDTSMNDFDFATIDRINSGILNEQYYSTYLTIIDHLKEEFSQTILVIHNNLNVSMFFFQRFKNLTCLLIRTHRISLTNWRKLLKSLKLNDIMISTNLKQQFLDILPVHQPMLQRLSIDNFENLDFVFRLKWLTCFTIQEFPSFEILKKLITSMKYLKVIKICVAESDFYSFTIDHNMIVFRCKDERIFSDSKESFLKSTIFNIQSWSDLLNINRNAICEVDFHANNYV